MNKFHAVHPPTGIILTDRKVKQHWCLWVTNTTQCDSILRDTQRIVDDEPIWTYDVKRWEGFRRGKLRERTIIIDSDSRNYCHPDALGTACRNLTNLCR